VGGGAARAAVRLRPGRQEGLRRGRPWVYRSEIAAVAGAPVTGDVVEVEDERGRFMARAFYHERSVLAARVLSREPDEPVDEGFFGRRIDAACALRERLCEDPTVCRLVFAEADGLPGLVVDRFGSVLVLQCLVAGMEARLGLLADLLVARTGVADVYERNDGPVRRLEGLPERRGPLRGTPPERLEVREGAVLLPVDLAHGQKTGHFLDQRANRLAFGRLVRRLLVEPGGRRIAVLDAFCNTGGFGLQALAAGAAGACFLDSAPAAVEAALHAAGRSGLPGAEGLVQNAFDALRAMEAEGRRWDAVVLDPPAFARGRAQLDGAYRGYKDLNLRAMRLLRPGGLLCTCSCSQPVTPEMFTEMLADAAADAGRRMRVLCRRGAPPDHPGLLGAVETQYLQCHMLLCAD
jgi:23S rRNA (cytosine1962-C5)-methyltransferase